MGKSFDAGRWFKLPPMVDHGRDGIITGRNSRDARRSASVGEMSAVVGSDQGRFRQPNRSRLVILSREHQPRRQREAMVRARDL